MRPSILLSRLALPVALIGLTTVMAAAPALAQPVTPASGEPVPSQSAPSVPAEKPNPEAAANALAAASASLSVAQEPLVVTTYNKNKSFKIQVKNAQDAKAEARDVVVTIDISGANADSVVTKRPGAADGCAAAGAVLTCKVDRLAAGATRDYAFEASGRKGAAPALIKVSAAASNAPSVGPGETRVSVVSSTDADVVVAPIKKLNLQPGASANLPIEVRNEGNKAANGVELLVAVEKYLELPTRYSNCRFDEKSGYLACLFDIVIQPGQRFRLQDSTPLPVRVATDAPGPASYAGVVGAAAIDDEMLAAAKASDPSKKVHLVAVEGPAAAELNAYDNFARFVVEVPRTVADTEAVGATIVGAIGETKSIKVGARNKGPADVLPASEEFALVTGVALPEGLEVIDVDDNCVPFVNDEPQFDKRSQAVGHVYVCWTEEGNLDAGASLLFNFDVKIVKADSGRGAVFVDGGEQDPNEGNNEAFIDVKVRGAGAGNGGNGNGGGSGGSNGEGLPVTGSPVAMMAGVGGVLLVGGVAAFFMTRRRKAVTTVE